MTIRYQSDLTDVTARELDGFFVGWKTPRTPEEHFQILQGSDHIVLAVDDDSGRVVGFITAITDGLQAAFIPLLEVLPEYRHRGIGSKLVKRMIGELKDYFCVDLTCDPDLQPFYARFGMIRSSGMVLRLY